MSVKDVINDLRQKGVGISVVDDKLRINAVKEMMTPELQTFIKGNKAEIISYVKELNQGIKPAAPKAYYLTSSAQRRLFFLYQLDESSLAYNLPNMVKLVGDLDIDSLTNAFKQLILRHESLRTSFDLIDGEPMQKIAETVDFKIEFFRKEENGKEAIKNFIRSFQLNKAPLFRVGLLQLAPEEHLLMVDMHHIISDGMSQGILIRDFMVLYDEMLLPEVQIQYKDYAEWQGSEESKKEVAQQKEFWLKEFAEETNTIDLPTDFSRMLVKNNEGNTLEFQLSEEETLAIKKLSQKEGLTDFMTIMAFFNLLLSKLSNQDDIVIGTPISGRLHTGLEDTMGMFVNILPLRIQGKGEWRFTQFLQEVKMKTLSCLENQSYQYEQLIKDLKVERNLSSFPLIDVMYIHQNFEEEEFKIPGLELKPYDWTNEISRFDLALTSMEQDGQFQLGFQYSTGLFKLETIKRLRDYFQRLVSSVLSNTEVKLADLELMSATEKQALLKSFNSAEINPSKEATLLELWKKQVEINSNQIAIQYGDLALSFEQVDAKANNICAYLQNDLGLQKGDFVGVLLERQEYLIPSLLAILKAGAVYVPIDPTYPIERKKAIVNTANLKVLISNGKDLDLLENDAVELLDLERSLSKIEANSSSPIPVNLTGEDLAYVIFTSGSTGVPKGVMVAHYSIVNYVNWAVPKYVKAEKVTFPLFTSISFDLTLTSIFVPLLSGNTIRLYPEEENQFTIDQVLQDNSVEVVKLTPSHLQLILNSTYFNQEGYQSKIKRLVVGGEELTTQLANEIDKLFDGKVEIYNEYGPTEATVGCMIHLFDREKDTRRTVPIGKAIAHSSVILLDRHLKPVPVGGLGELYVSGMGLAKGYHNAPDQTAERFIENPFVEQGRLYRTGDLARQLADGNLEFLGRIDKQVKIRGFRIELGEIENVLLNFDSVEKAVVLVKENKDEKYLMAYYTAAEQLEELDLKAFLAGKLPLYLIPSHFVYLNEIPLTPNGKLDKKALPDPELKDRDESFKPSNEIEEKLVKIWSDIIKIDESKIDVNSNFFSLGGHSLTTYTLLSKIEEEFNVKISLVAFFEKPTIKDIYQQILMTRVTQNNDSSKAINKVTI